MDLGHEGPRVCDEGLCLVKVIFADGMKCLIVEVEVRPNWPHRKRGCQKSKAWIINLSRLTDRDRFRWPTDVSHSEKACGRNRNISYATSMNADVSRFAQWKLGKGLPSAAELRRESLAPGLLADVELLKPRLHGSRGIGSKATIYYFWNAASGC